MNQKPFLSLMLFCVSFIAEAQIELVIPSGHNRRVVDVKIAPNAQWMASIDGSDVVTIWNHYTGKEIYHFKGSGPLTSIAYSKENSIYAADGSGAITLFDAQGLRIRSILTDRPIISLFSQGNDSLLVVAPQKLSWYFKGKEISTQEVKTPITSSVIKQNQLLVGNEKGQVEIYESGTFKSVKRIQLSESSIISACTTPNGFAVGNQKGELTIIDQSSFETTSSQAFSLRTLDITYIPHTQQLLACGRDSKHNLKAFDLDLKENALPFKWIEDMSQEAFNFGLRVLETATDSTFLFADYQNQIREYDLKNDNWIQVYQGLAAPIYDLAVDRLHQKLAIASRSNQIKVIDLTGTTADLSLPGSTNGSGAVSFHPVNPVLASYGLDQTISVQNLLTQKEILRLKAKGNYQNTPITFDPTGRYILRKSSEEDFDMYNFSASGPQNFKVKNGSGYVFSTDGRKLVFQTNDELISFDPITFKKLNQKAVSNIQQLSMSPAGMLATLLKDDLTVSFYDVKNLSKSGTITLEAPSDVLYWSPSGKELIGTRNSVNRGEETDYSIKIYEAASGKLINKLSGHSGFTNDVVFINDNMLTSSIDGTIKIWNIATSNDPLKGILVPLQDNQYVITTPAGLFDATSEAMNLLHFVKQGQVINLEQIKNSYYEPMLLSKILGLNMEPIRNTTNLTNTSLHPELSLRHPLKNDGKLGINLNNNGGGIGRVIILINGKEVSSDVRSTGTTPNASSLEIDYDITDHPFLYTDRVNKITIKAFNTDETISSEEKSVYVFGEEKVLEAPNLYAIIAGTSDYEGDALDLKYAAKDAADLASALQLSAGKYLGKDKTNITLLTTDQEKKSWPTKANIQKAFQIYQAKAKPNDILFVYLSGHGVNHSGEHSDFYYLTSDASSGDMNNSISRTEDAISSEEFTEYIKSVPALKQILIIDACHSGRLASSIASSRSAMSSTQIRALERMKDRTGLFVLAGSAADAVSYETTLYGQGLLTYSLLFGMKGAALRDNEFIDVLSLFQFAANKVPELAEEIGGIQKPEIRIPEEGKSFDIGRLEIKDREAIKLAAPKPVYVHSRFQDESTIFDRLNINELMDQRLLELSKGSDAPIVFVDDKNFSGAIIINGRYQESDGLVKAKINLVTNHSIIKSLELEAVNAALLAEAILDQLDY